MPEQPTPHVGPAAGLVDDTPGVYDELVDRFHDKLAGRVQAALKQLRALERDLEEIRLDLESGP